MYKVEDLDIAVIGAGHAGIEAGLSAARLGCRVGVFTIAWMPWAICPVIRRSAARQKGIWFVRSTRWGAKWEKRQTQRFCKAGC